VLAASYLGDRSMPRGARLAMTPGRPRTTPGTLRQSIPNRGERDAHGTCGRRIVPRSAERYEAAEPRDFADP
jgi:hypothetical protein